MNAEAYQSLSPDQKWAQGTILNLPNGVRVSHMTDIGWTTERRKDLFENLCNNPRRNELVEADKVHVVVRPFPDPTGQNRVAWTIITYRTPEFLGKELRFNNFDKTIQENFGGRSMYHDLEVTMPESGVYYVYYPLEEVKKLLGLIPQLPAAYAEKIFSLPV